jgi:hypothetical protein
MSDEAQNKHAQQFEHAIATAFACRSIIKYNSTLNEAQQNELLTDIDKTVAFLQERLTAHKVIETNTLLAQFRHSGLFSSNTLLEADSKSENDDKQLKRKFDSLYRMYHFYFDTQPGHGMDAFFARFNEIMSTIDQVQHFVERSPNLYSNPSSVEDHLHKVRGYVADMYTVFSEFARALSNALQGMDIYIDTEKQASLQQFQGEEKQDIRPIAPLIKVYETHQQLNEIIGTVTSRASEATAFLIFLQDQLDKTVNKRDEIIVQINHVAKLLNDLTCRLADYENTVATLLRY